MIKNLPTIQIDTREQQPWTFASAYRNNKIKGTFLKGLDAGDYSLLDVPNFVIIERKKNVAELYNNLIPNEKYDRFIREMERLQLYKYKYIIVEQTWDELYNNSNFKFAKQNMTRAGAIVLGSMLSIMNKYGINIIFAGKNAEHTAATILIKHYNESIHE